MTSFAIGLIVIWLIGIVIFAARFLNFTRLLYNNLDPVDPANITELGRQYQERAMPANGSHQLRYVRGFARICEARAALTASIYVSSAKARRFS